MGPGLRPLPALCFRRGGRLSSWQVSNLCPKHARDMDGLVVCAVDRQSSSSRVRTLVPPRVQGPVGNTLATAPLIIQLNHRYRRWMGGVSRHRILLFACHEPPAAARSATGTASRRPAHLILVLFFSLRVRTGDFKAHGGSFTPIMRRPRTPTLTPVPRVLAFRRYGYKQPLTHSPPPTPSAPSQHMSSSRTRGHCPRVRLQHSGLAHWSLHAGKHRSTDNGCRTR